MDNIKLVGGVVILGVLIAVVLLVNPVVIIDTGHRGIVTKFGEVIGQPLEEGMHFRTPFVDHVVELDTRTQRADDTLITYTQDVQQVTISTAINYNLKRTAAGDVYKEVGTGWEKVLLAPALSGTIKEIVGKWDAVDLVGNRNKAAADIIAALQDSLDSRGVTVSHFEITQVKFNEDFEHAVEEKVKAVQNAQREQNRTVEIEEQAKQKVITANAEAEALLVKNRALAQSPRLIDYEAVQKWDGKLPTQMVPNSTVPFINLNNLK